MKKIILSLLVTLTTTGIWAQGPTTSGITWNTGTNSGTFAMPAYDVEVTTELWYKLEEDADNSSDLKAKKNVYLVRTLQTGGWNTFSVPFNIYPIPAGWTVKKLTDSEYNSTTKVLTLIFDEETTQIEAGKPYLIQVDATYDFTADDHEFSDITQDYTAHNAETTYADFVPVMDRAYLTAGQDKLFVVGNTLTYPNADGYMKGFRAYFQLRGGAESAAPTAFRMDFGEETVTGILNVEATEMRQTGIYTIDGRKLDRLPNIPGVYIVNGQKVINY